MIRKRTNCSKNSRGLSTVSKEAESVKVWRVMGNSQGSAELNIQRVEHLASQLGFRLDRLIEIAENTDSLYVDFEKNVRGKVRKLTMAKKPLELVQRRILTRILCRLPVSDHAFGAIKGRSIRDNALAHASAPFVAKLDIHNFYPSIRHEKVFEFFLYTQRCSPDVARILTKLTTRKYALPLGTSTSPFIADQIISPIDTRIGKMAKMHGLNYTRYVDDLTLSGSFDLTRYTKQLTTIIQQSGFKISHNKLVFYRPNDGQERIITGVQIKEGQVFAPKTYVESLADELRQAQEASRHQTVCGDFDTKAQFQGRIAYVMWLDPSEGHHLLRLYKKVKWKHLEYAGKFSHR